MEQAKPGDKDYISDEALEEALEAHKACVMALAAIPVPDQRNVLESVARFQNIYVEPGVADAISQVGKAIAYGMDVYAQQKGGGQVPAQGVSADPGTENIVSLLSRLMRRFPEERREEIRDFVIGIYQECHAASSSAPSSSPSSDSEPAPQE